MSYKVKQDEWGEVHSCLKNQTYLLTDTDTDTYFIVLFCVSLEIYSSPAMEERGRG